MPVKEKLERHFSLEKETLKPQQMIMTGSVMVCTFGKTAFIALKSMVKS